MQNLSVIILAAGKGTRMKSDLPKVMHKVAGREMLNMVIDEAKNLNPRNIVIVISEEFEDYKEKIKDEHQDIEILFALQKERKGTADAVKVGFEKLEKNTKNLAEKILILYGDTPLISEKNLDLMLKKLDENFSLCILGFDCHDQNSYGRLIIDVNNHLERIVEFKDASLKEREILLCNSGVIAIKKDSLTKFLPKISNNNAAQEFYLTDIVKIVNDNNLKSTFIKTSENEVLGVNSRSELARVESIKQNLLRKKHMDNGVTILDPLSVYFSFDTKISHDVLIYPHVFFGKNVTIEKNVEIKEFSSIDGAKISENAIIGPFARIRPGTKIGQNVRIGNFVEIKKSYLKKGAKVNHLSYVGDSEIGHNSNIGAGVITCNYDGYNKFNTIIGDDVFVGSNCALIAPVEINDGVVIAAGSTITKNVEKDALAFARTKQSNLENGGKKYHLNKSNKKDK